MADGSYNVTASATDILGNSGSATIPVKLDRNPPELSVTGALPDADGRWAGQSAAMSVSATDGTPSSPRSGMKQLVIKVDGQVRKTQPCSGFTCSTGFTWDGANLLEASHRIEVVATDQLDQARTRTYNVKLDKTRPAVAPSGGLWDLDEQTIGDTQYGVRLDGNDGSDVRPSSGARNITVKVDDATVASKDASDCPVDNCELAMDWTLVTRSLTPRVAHTITYTVTDAVGLTDTATQTVLPDPVEDRPAASATTASRSSLRIDGAQGSLLGLGGDRLGSAVAAIGDQNADGKEDYAIGAPNATLGAGQTYVIYGGQTGVIDTASLTAAQGYVINGALATDRSGSSVAPAGDIDGDDITDFLIGAPGNRVLPGKVYAVFGGRCRGFSLGSPGTCGFVINGPLPNPLDLLTDTPGFGASLSGPSSGPRATGADVNDDGRDDIVIGNAAADNTSRADSGSVYVIYGKADTASVDASALAGKGWRVDGAGAAERTGTGATPAGDLNADGLDDLLIGSPGGTPKGRTAAGSAFVVYGKTDDNGIDLQSLTPAAGYRVVGAPGDRLGSSVASIGDADGDALPDIAVGGGGATVVLGSPAQPDEVDLTLDDPRVFKTAAPAAATDTSTVRAGGDLNEDGLADLLTSYPSTSNVHALVSQDTLKQPYRAGLDPSTAGGQEVYTYRSSSSGDRNGDSIAGSQGTDGSEMIVGQPGASNNNRTAAGSVTVVRARPDGTTFSRPEDRCAPAAGYDYYIPQLEPAPGQPAIDRRNDFTFWRCRITTAGNEERTPSRSRCGSMNTAPCRRDGGYVSSFGERGGINARQPIRVPLRDQEIAAGEMDKMAEGASVEYPNIPSDPTRREYAWPIKDSANATLGYIRIVAPRADSVNNLTGAQVPGVPLGLVRTWNAQMQFMGQTDPAKYRNRDLRANLFNLEGKACETSPVSLKDETALIFFSNDGGAVNSGALNGNPLALRGLISRKAFAPKSFTSKSEITNDQAIDTYYAPCARPGRQLADAQGGGVKTYKVPQNFVRPTSPGTGDRYQSRNAVQNDKPSEAGTCGSNAALALFNPTCGAPWVNYTYPDLLGGAGKPQYPPHAILVPSTTGVNGGGITRGVLITGTAGKSVRVFDRFNYLDPNRPCGQAEVGSWNLIRFGRVYLWAPRRLGDGNLPAVAAPSGQERPACAP